MGKNIFTILVAIFLFAIYQITAYAQPIRVVCIGNSITYGSGPTDTYSYPAQLAGLLGSNYSVLNCGNSGKTMSPQTGSNSYWTQVEFTNAKNFDPQIVTIALGTNDATSVNWGSRRDIFHDDYVAMIQAFRQGGKNPQIFVCIPPPSTSGGREPNLVEVRQIIRTVAQEMDTEIIDFYNTLLPYFPSTFPDRLHPNSEGAQIMATEVYQAIQRTATDATLNSLTVSSGTLNPIFSAATISYIVGVDHSVSSITLTGISTRAQATVTGNGTKTLTVGNNVFTITVTAQDGSTKKNYQVTVIRTAPILPPTVNSLSSLPYGNTGIALSGNLVISFNKALKTTEGTVSLSGGEGTISTTKTWSNYNTSCTITYSRLSYSTKYTFSISGFQEASESVTMDAVSYSFTTRPISTIMEESTSRIIVLGNMVNIGQMNSLLPVYLKAANHTSTLLNNSGTLNVRGIDVGASTTLYNSGTANIAEFW
jgi:lysophospholipase L1-like esterase